MIATALAGVTKVSAIQWGKTGCARVNTFCSSAVDSIAVGISSVILVVALV